MRLLTTLLRFVQYTSIKNKIDESHSLGHSMKVLHYAQEGIRYQVPKSPQLKQQEPIIYTAAILHDLYDRKYKTVNVPDISLVLEYKLKPHEIKVVDQIIHTMSYSTVKKEGFPYMGDYQMAYHIVREADLLASYDADRAFIYHMFHSNDDIWKTYEESREFCNNRVLKYHEDNLFMTDYGKSKGLELRTKLNEQLDSWKSIIHTYDRYI